MEKEGLLVFILISLLVFSMSLSFVSAANATENSSAGNASTSISCTDGDGSDYYAKGSVDYKKYSNGNLIATSNPADACVDAIINGIMKEDVLREYFCTSNKEVDYVHYECPDGCSDGACISAANATNASQTSSNATANVSVPIENASSSGNNTTSNAAESSASEGGLGSLAPTNANATGENAVISETNATCENGCLLNEKCYLFGYRKSGKYCSEEGAFKEELQGNGICENNFECESNLCVNGECLSATLWQKIINWFKKFFT